MTTVATATREYGAAVRFAAAAAGDGVRRIQGVHGAVARRSWAPTGPAGVPSRMVHDLAAAGAYGAVRAGFEVAGRGAGAVVDGVAGAARWPPLSSSPRGGAFLGIVNGFAGDRLQERGSELALEMAIRHRGADVPVEADPLRAAFPAATGDVAVFLHGLVENDRSWWWAAGRYYGDPDVSYGTRLRDDLGITPVYLRYNTGLPVTVNGRRLDDLLATLVDAWPVPVERLNLVGHSMGGLVIRSACHRGAAERRPWVGTVRHAVYLGTPHHGAPLARGSMALGAALARIPEVRPFARVLERPSAGIRDLRHGVVVADEDRDTEAPEEWFGEEGGDTPLLPDCRHHAVASTLTGRRHSVVGRMVGDLFVQTTSATGRSKGRRHVDFLAEEGMALGGAHHFALLNHPAVYDELRRWLSQ
jgi:PGAP1-like protein